MRHAHGITQAASNEYKKQTKEKASTNLSKQQVELSVKTTRQGGKIIEADSLNKGQLRLFRREKGRPRNARNRGSGEGPPAL